MVAIASTRDCLQNFVKVLIWSFDHLLIIRLESIIDLNFKHLAQMSTVLVDFLIPADHWLVTALYTLHYTMSKELVVVGQKSSWLLGFHLESSTKCVQYKLQRAFGFTWIPCYIHLHYVHTILHWLPLIRLEPSSPIKTKCWRKCCFFTWRLIGMRWSFKLSIIFPIGVKVQNILISSNSSHVPLYSLKQFPNFFWITGYI